MIWEWLNDNLEKIQAYSEIAIAISIPLAIITFIFEVRNYRRDSKISAFNEIDESFVALHQTMLAHPDLNVSIYHPKKKSTRLAKMSRDQKIQSCLIFDIQTSLFERAHFLLDNAPRDLRKRLRGGWTKYIGLHCQNPLYREWWAREDYGYDPEFARYLDKLMKKHNR